MASSNSHLPYPLWVRVVCCVTPLLCVLALSVSAAFGTTISLGIAVGVASLCGLVIRHVV